MARKRSAPNKPAPVAVAAPPSLSAQLIAPIVGVAVAAQSLAWIVLYQLFGVMRVGYWFFDLSDIRDPYFPYALNIAKGLVAYRDFFIEYPPLFVPLLVAAGKPVTELGYTYAFSGLMVAFMIAAGAVTAIAAIDEHSASRPYVVAGIFAVLVLVLGQISANRYDPVVALVLALALLFMVRRKWELAGIVLGVGFALKITPALLLPLVLILPPTRRAIQSFIGFTVAALLPFICVLTLGGQALDSLHQMLAYHLTRPLEIESVLATPLWIGKLAGATVVTGNAAGSQVIQSAAANSLASLSTFVLLAALGVTFWFVWRRRQTILAAPTQMVLASLATILASFVGSKVLSPQYFVWVIPAVALVAVDRKLLGGMMVVILLLTQVLFPANYWAFALYLQDGPIALVVVRNILVLVAFGLSLYHLWTLPARPGVTRAK